MSKSTPAALPADYHTHNRLCKHAEDKPAAYAEAGARAGVTAVAATDHCPTDERFGIEHRMELEDFPTYLRWVRQAQEDAPLPLLLGVEADYYRGCERFLAPWLDRHPFDLVLGSVHFLDYWAAKPEDRTLADHPDRAHIWRTYFTLIGELAGTGLYDIVAHLDLPKKFIPPPGERALRELALPALDRIAEAGLAIEINTSGLNHACKELYPSLPLLTWACERGIGLTFGSDAHSPARVGADFDRALAWARAAGYREGVVFEARRARRVPLPP